MNARRRTLSLQGWMLAILLPTLGAAILVQAALLDRGLQRFIVEGFDQKLTAVGTTVAAFVDPAEHARLMGAVPLGSLSLDAGDHSLWALDRARHTLVRIDPQDGRAADTGVAVSDEIDAIGSDSTPGSFYLADSETGRFFQFALADRRSVPTLRIEPPIQALALAPGRIFVAGRDLRVIETSSGRILRSFPLAGGLRDLTWDGDRQQLWALDRTGTLLLALDPATGKVVSRQSLAYAGGGDGAELQSLAYDASRHQLWGTGSSLLKVNARTAEVSGAGFAPSFGQETGAVYRAYAEAMQHIQKRAGLTYLYTQEIQGRDRIIYGLDATIGPLHSALLTLDTARSTEVDGLHRVMTDGSTYVSGIERWPPWGLIKSAFAPIFNEQGRPVAMVGADVRAGAIERQIRGALVLAFGFGGAMLILGGLLTLVISRRMTGPLNAIRASALLVAAGDFSRKLAVRRPRELRELAERFVAASLRLGQEQAEMKATLSSHQETRDRTGLIERLAHAAPLAPLAPPGLAWAWGEFGPKPAGSDTPSGAVFSAERGQGLAWIGRRQDNELAAAARRVEIAATAEALLRAHGGEMETLAAQLEHLFTGEVAAWAILSGGALRVRVREEGLLFRVVAGQGQAIFPADFGMELRPGPGQAIVLASPGAPLEALPDPEFIAEAGALFAAWRAVAPPESPRTFAVLQTAGGEFG